MNSPDHETRFIEIVHRLRPQILCIAGSKLSGEELLSDVLFACLRHPEYDWTHGQIQGRVLQIAKNRWRDQCRRRAVREHGVLADDIESKASAESEVLASDLLHFVAEKLGSGESEILRLVAIEGWKLSSVASHCGVSLNAMRSHWFRLRQQLQALLKQSCLAT